MNTIFSALAGAERVFGVMDMDTEAVSGRTGEIMPVRGDIEFRDVTFGYNPDRIILKDISLKASKGQKIAFVGSTGAGKTTITNLLTRFYEIQSGLITIDGHDIRTIDKDELRKI